MDIFNMNFTDTARLLFFVLFFCLLGYGLFSWMSKKKKKKEGLENLGDVSTTTSLPGGTTNVDNYNNILTSYLQSRQADLYVPNNPTLNTQYSQSYNNSLTSFKNIVGLLQTQIPLSIDLSSMDSSNCVVGNNIINQMAILNTLSEGSQKLKNISYHVS
jgi:hypothetical protein